MNARGLLVLAVLVLAGCASGHTSAASPPTQVRCLSDPTERDTRPLIFLFCIQSP